jgi:hypothetical protein
MLTWRVADWEWSERGGRGRAKMTLRRQDSSAVLWIVLEAREHAQHRGANMILLAVGARRGVFVTREWGMVGDTINAHHARQFLFRNGK